MQTCGRAERARTDEAHNLLVLDLLGLVDVLAGQRRVLLRVHCGQCVQRRQHNPHEVRVMRQRRHLCEHRSLTRSLQPS